jgi:hypothetical protein
VSHLSPVEIRRALARLAPEARLSIPEAANLLGVCPSCALRWVIRGYRGVHLDGGREGAEWFTSREAVARFVEARAALEAGASSEGCGDG